MSVMKLAASFVFTALLGISANLQSAEVCTSIGAASYYVVTHQDMRKCAAPMCGGYFVKEVNKEKTVCADGVMRNECHVFQLDTQNLSWGQQQTDEYFNQVFGQKRGIVRGNFAHALDAKQPVPSNFPSADTLTVAEAWQAQTKHELPEILYRVKDMGIVCVTYPCLDDTIEQVLNAWQMKDRLISDIRFDKSGASQEQIEAAQQTFSKTGLIVAGKHRPTSDKKGTLLWVSQFYLPVAAKAEPQACGGAIDVACPTGQFCNITTPNACGSSTVQGACQVKPEVCTQEYAPVCGCDNVTYGNDCQRMAAGAQLAYTGECKK